MLARIKQLHEWCNRHEWVIFLVILGLILRLPSLFMPHYYGDEEIYFVMGRAWSSGVPLYQAMFDHKPPLIYIMAGIAPTMFAFRGLLAILMAVHTILFWNLSKLIFANTKKYLPHLASLIFVLLSTLPTFEGLTVNAELLMMIPVTAILLLFYKLKEKDKIEYYKYPLAGLLGGIAWLFKIPVMFDVMAIGLYFFVFTKKSLREGISSLLSKEFLAYVIAFVSPLLLSFVYYYVKGTGPDYLETVLTVNLGYVSSWSTSTYTFNPFKSGLVVRGTILLGFTIFLYLVRSKIPKNFTLVMLWLGFSLFGALLSARPYPHYLQEIVAPISLLIPYVFLIESWLGWLLIGLGVFTGILVQRQINFWGYPTISVYKNYFEYATKKIGWDEYLSRFDNATRNYGVAKYLNERMESHDEIFVWGTDPTIYNLTNKLPTGGKYIVSFHVRDLKKYDYVISNLKKNKPKYVIILPNSGDFDELVSWLDQDYFMIKTIEGVELYRRMNP